MNAKNLIVAVAVFAAAGSVLANQTYPFVDQGKFTSTRTRAEVRAELEQAHVAGLHTSTNTPEFFDGTSLASNQTNGEVRKGTIQAAKDK